MLRINKLKMTLNERAAQERAAAQAAKNAADIDYLAMMTDVELPEEGVDDAQQEV
jgi:hypothetical protein